MGLFTFLSGKDSALSEPAHGLYRAAVTAARAPVFYAAHGVPDTPDGRFDIVALHVFLTLRRLKRDGGTTAMALAQALTDLMFADMDRNLRELAGGAPPEDGRPEAPLGPRPGNGEREEG